MNMLARTCASRSMLDSRGLLIEARTTKVVVGDGEGCKHAFTKSLPSSESIVVRRPRDQDT